MKVCVIGGGLAGLSTALAIKNDAIAVTLLEASNYDRFCAGEHLASQGLNVLNVLGCPATIWESNSVSCVEVQSAWGSNEFYVKNSILNPYGGGVLLTRPSFDADLSQFVHKSGIDLRTNAKVYCLERKLKQWLVKYKNKLGNHELSADFIVDASGRNTKYASFFGASKLKYDNLVAITAFITSEKCNHGIPAGTIKIEAAFYGWCYFAALRDQTLVVSLMTDSIVVAKYGTTTKAFRQLIPSTTVGSNVINKGGEFETIATCSAQTQILDKVAGEGWLSVGDAAWSADPLSSLGMSKAIISGVNAAKTINDCFLKKGSVLEGYEQGVRKEFYKYLTERSKYYRMEARWSNEDFWRKRHQLNWLESSVKLHPMQRLAFDSEISLQTKQHISELVPSIDCDFLISVITKSKTACEAVRKYKKHMADATTDKEIVIAIQELIEL